MKPDRDRIRWRAGGRCEYCHLPEALSGAAFHVEHVVSKARGGTDWESNLALACPRCNERKADRVRAHDPRTGKEVDLFHPRRNVWARHFRWSADRLRIEGRTEIGRATVLRLGLNALTRQHLRLIWRERLADLFSFI